MQFRSHSAWRSRPAAIVAVGAAFALLCAVLSVSRISLLPPKLEGRHLEVGAAATRVVVDTPESSIVTQFTTGTKFAGLTDRADVLGRIMASPPARRHLAREIGVPSSEIAAVSRLTANVPLRLREPGSEQRAAEIASSEDPFRLDIQPHPEEPWFDVYAQAPSADRARRLADGAVEGLRSYMGEMAAREGIRFDAQLALRQTGPARGGVINPGIRLQVAGLTFFVVFTLTCVVLGLLARLRRGSRVTPQADSANPSESGPSPQRLVWPSTGPTVSAATASAGTLALPRMPSWDAAAALRLSRLRASVTYGGDWPRTTRVLPWLLAAFMALLWLVPFNSITLSIPLPFDLKLDRLVLPFLLVTWLLALAGGGPTAPRLRLTPIHVAVGAFIGLACLSVVFAAPYLNQTLELDQSIKKLSLLIAYLLLFIVVASVVRPGEVRAFLNYQLLLAGICALAMIWEYRFEYNVFYDLAGMLPAIFEVETLDPYVFDGIDRPDTRGPADLGLEAVAMLTMALPIALAGLIHATRWRARVLYGLAACLLMAAAVSTYRKSAFLAPIAVILTFAYFRPRHLLRLAPLGVVGVVVVHFLSPAALGSIAFQLNRDSLDVATVGDRTADYDAIRPDVWSHLAFGRGFGSYGQTDYRILDSEILHRVVETGVVGLAAYLLMFIAVVVVARRAILARHPLWSPPALAGAAAAVAFLMVSTLYDVMSFPHTPYIFLGLAALVSVVSISHEEDT
jgi:hypothetical protein